MHAHLALPSSVPRRHFRCLGTRSSCAARPLVEPCLPRQAQSTCTAWHEPCKPMLWTGTTEEAMACDVRPMPSLCDPSLPALWKVLVLSDGSVTRHLQILTGTKVQVDCLSMDNIGDTLEGLPLEASVIEGPRVQRQVLLRAGSDQTPLVYACSWWNADQIDEFLRDKSQPIWISLSQGHLELYREVQLVSYGHNDKLEELLECQGPFWGRQYIFWHNQRPLTLIYEVFSDKLKSFM